MLNTRTHITLFWTAVGLFGLFSVLSTISCRPHVSNSSDDRIAEMGAHVLLKRDLMEEGISLQDTDAVNNYVNTWVRDALFADEGQAHISEEERAEITRMVDNYRQMLFRNAYEKHLSNTEVEDTIDRGDLEGFYKAHQAQLSLDHPIMRYRHVVVPAGKKALRSMLAIMKSKYPKDRQTLRDWCRLNNAKCWLNDTVWQPWSSVQKSLPSGIILNKSDIGKSVKVKQKGQEHYFYLSGYKAQGDTPPMVYIEDNLKKGILFQRKRELIERRRKELYNKAIQQGKLRVHLIRNKRTKPGVQDVHQRSGNNIIHSNAK